MRRLRYALLLLLGFASLASGQWVEGARLGIQAGNSKGPIVIFLTTVTPTASWVPFNMTPGYWYDIDVTKLGVPADAIGVFVSGLLIITHGSTQDQVNLTAAFRSPGDTLACGNYQLQTLDPWAGGGQRTNAATWVPVKNGRFQFCWNTNQVQQYPVGSAVGINLSLQAYLR